MAGRIHEVITSDFGTSPMFPMYFLYLSGGVYHYSAYCCNPADPDWATIHSNEQIPRQNLGCSKTGGPGSGDGEPTGVQQDFLTRVIRAIPDGRNPDGSLNTRKSISNGVKIGSGAPVPRLPPASQIPTVRPTDIGEYCVVEDLYTGGDEGNLVTLFGETDSDLYLGRMFRLRKVVDVFAGREFVSAISIRYDASMNPRRIVIDRLQTIKLTPGLSPAVAIFPKEGSDLATGPYWDIAIVNHDLT